MDPEASLGQAISNIKCNNSEKKDQIHDNLFYNFIGKYCMYRANMVYIHMEQQTKGIKGEYNDNIVN